MLTPLFIFVALLALFMLFRACLAAVKLLIYALAFAVAFPCMVLWAFIKWLTS